MKQRWSGSPALLSISAASVLLEKGSLTAVTLLEACIERIEARDIAVGAWANIDLVGARAAAAEADRSQRKGPLHGIPVGIKDVFDTAGMPTGYGSPIYAKHVPDVDAVCVRQLRRAGAIVLGKTVTTEFAAYCSGKTTNPFNPLHTPGGSSSGSAAAVADCQVGIALGTQTSGSTIRPASFNGVLGYKPTFGEFNMSGVKPLAPSLDTLGLFAREFGDFTLIRRALGALSSRPSSNGPMRIGVCRTERWQSAEPAMREMFERTAVTLADSGAMLKEVVLPRQFDVLHAAHQVLMSCEASRAYTYERRAHDALLSSSFRQLLAEGATYTDREETEAWRQVHACREYFRVMMRDFDVLLTLAAPGEAPLNLDYTGNPMFNRIWTLLGVPCVTYPVGRGPLGLPLGVQVVGPTSGDELLLACAAKMYELSGTVLTPPSLAVTA